MIRRSFLKAIGTALVGLTLARTLPGIGGEITVVSPPDWTDTFKAGDIFTIEGVYLHNGDLQEFI